MGSSEAAEAKLEKAQALTRELENLLHDSEEERDEARAKLAIAVTLLSETKDMEITDCCGSGYTCLGGRIESKEYKEWSRRRDTALAAIADAEEEKK